ncbi:hypothetical protein Hdeb2414_s0004g00130801 [Helianthus debilis subsp. tardiflorus]
MGFRGLCIDFQPKSGNTGKKTYRVVGHTQDYNTAYKVVAWPVFFRLSGD